jgi:serine/threonine protein kinase
VVLDIATGLHYLHSFQVTHFDLKSANILLDTKLTAKIADVGLAVSGTGPACCTEEALLTFRGRARYQVFFCFREKSLLH